MLIARHGETLDNANRLILGHRDPPLSERGRCQAAELGVRAVRAGVVAIWCSPLIRAEETAAIVADSVEVEPWVLQDLIESDRGDWEGRPVSEIAERSPEAYAAFEAGDPEFAFPGGESLASQVRRTRVALGIVAAGRGPSLVVAHAGTIRATMIALGRAVPPERSLPHGEWVEVTWSAEDPALP
jgi:broad specificity phosphatase PhoE